LGTANFLHYVASKAALIGMTHSLAMLARMKGTNRHEIHMLLTHTSLQVVKFFRIVVKDSIFGLLANVGLLS
jgi:NAD(P)-dependent dehydrogenase (short-subunit alcohol dehydrogenase family)